MRKPVVNDRNKQRQDLCLMNNNLGITMHDQKLTYLEQNITQQFVFFATQPLSRSMCSLYMNI